MGDCCSTDTAASAPCPACGATGPAVGAAPVRAHRPAAADGPWRYCATAGCPVAFHLDGATVAEAELVARVGAKAPTRPEPVCFCFAHTRDALAADLAAHGGTSTIKAAIKDAVAGGLCACQHLNPDGSCCLPAVQRALKAMAAAPAPAPAGR